jgi:hypothetical protein
MSPQVLACVTTRQDLPLRPHLRTAPIAVSALNVISGREHLDNSPIQPIYGTFNELGQRLSPEHPGPSMSTPVALLPYTSGSVNNGNRSSDSLLRANSPLDMGWITRLPHRRWASTRPPARCVTLFCCRMGFAPGQARRLLPAAWHGVHPSLSRSGMHSPPRLSVSPTPFPPCVRLFRRFAQGFPSSTRRDHPPRWTPRLRWTWGPSLIFCASPSSSGCTG